MFLLQNFYKYFDTLKILYFEIERTAEIMLNWGKTTPLYGEHLNRKR